MIECYLHSDSSQKNKGGCLVDVVGETDFVNGDEDFVKFAKRLAMFCYGNSVKDWQTLSEICHWLVKEKEELEAKLKEKITLRRVVMMYPHNDCKCACNNKKCNKELSAKILELLKNDPDKKFTAWEVYLAVIGEDRKMGIYSEVVDALHGLWKNVEVCDRQYKFRS